MRLEHPDAVASTATAHLAAVNAAAEDDEYLHMLLHHAAAESDRQAQASQRSLRMSWRITIAACGVVAVETLFLAAGAAYMQTRPPPAPKVLVVEKASGKIEPLVSLAEYQMSPEDATIRRYVATFIRACENYSIGSAQDNYYDCAAFLSQPLRAQWESAWELSNPTSPLNVYKQDRRVQNEVGAITILRDNQGKATGARASFTRTELRNEQQEGAASEWIATIAFHWVNAPTSERQRRVNDLGWEVTEYIRDRDVGAAPKPTMPPLQPTPLLNAAPAAPVALSAPRGTP
jgi:type IV secretion system protein VirB8